MASTGDSFGGFTCCIAVAYILGIDYGSARPAPKCDNQSKVLVERVYKDGSRACTYLDVPAARTTRTTNKASTRPRPDTPRLLAANTVN